jgi:hypothetical protein
MRDRSLVQSNKMFDFKIREVESVSQTNGQANGQANGHANGHANGYA